MANILVYPDARLIFDQFMGSYKDWWSEELEEPSHGKDLINRIGTLGFDDTFWSDEFEKEKQYHQNSAFLAHQYAIVYPKHVSGIKTSHGIFYEYVITPLVVFTWIDEEKKEPIHQKSLHKY